MGDIVQRAIRVPVQTIANNAGVEGAVVVGKLLETSETTQGYDAQNDQYTDMFGAGIIDPTKVVKTGLVDASGIASIMATSECIIRFARGKRWRRWHARWWHGRHGRHG